MSVIEKDLGSDLIDLLKKNGNLIREKLQQLLHSDDLHISQNLSEILSQEFAQYSQTILDQLAIMDQPLIFKTNGKQDSQFAYEMKMGKQLLNRAEQVKKILEIEDQEVADLFFAILTSDIGKVGPKTPTHPEELVIGRLFSQAIFSEIHKNWLKRTRPSQLPKAIRELLRQLSYKEISGIFRRGEFKQQPIDFYLHMIKSVALEIAGENQQLKAQAEKIFTLTEAERFVFLSLGTNTRTQAVGRFFTLSHVTFGERFLSLQNVIPKEKKGLINLALAHHFSQGVLPKNMDSESTIADEALMRKIAFLEILDKCDAFGSRFKVEEHDSARNKTWEFINTELRKNYPNHPELISLYRQIFEKMIEEKVI